MVAVAFDMDRTLSERDHILAVYSELDLCDEAKELHDRYRKGEISHEELWEGGTELIRGIEREKLLEIADRIQLKSGAAECIDRLKDEGYDVFVLTDGFVELVEKKVPCKVYGKSIEYRDGKVDSLGGDPITHALLHKNGKSRLLKAAAYDKVLVVDDHPENFDFGIDAINPNLFHDFSAVADYIMETYPIERRKRYNRAKMAL